MKKIKIVFAWTPSFAAKYLQSLVSDSRFEISAIISQEDKKIWRKQILTETETKKIWIQNNIPVFQPKTKSEITEILKKEKPDFLVVVAYWKILPIEALKVAKFNINVHWSILPKYRWASPVQSAILNWDSETWISIMNIEEKMDVWAVWNIHKCKIEKFDTSEKIFEKLEKFSENFWDDLVNIFNTTKIWKLKSKFKAIPQDDNLATYCKKISKEDWKINFKKETAKNIFYKLNSFTPWPWIFCYFWDKKLKILKADFVKNLPEKLENNLNNSEKILLKIKNFFTIKKIFKQFWKIFLVNKKIFIQTKSWFLELLEIQLEWKKPQKIWDFINWNKNFIWNNLK